MSKLFSYNIKQISINSLMNVTENSCSIIMKNSYQLLTAALRTSSKDRNRFCPKCHRENKASHFCLVPGINNIQT